MKITVDRTLSPEGHLVFTVTCKEPHLTCMTEQETEALEGLDLFTHQMSSLISPEMSQLIENANHEVKGKIFNKVLENLRFAIQNEFRPKFLPICQEIYNWIYDLQSGNIKKWMMQFDSQRTTYYFDNDARLEQNKISSPFLYPEDKDEEDDDEDDYDEDLDD